MAASTRDLNTIRRGCTNKAIRALILAALKTGARYRMTKNGIIIYTETGLTVGTHFTVSDHRGAKNLQAQMRRAGFEID